MLKAFLYVRFDCFSIFAASTLCYAFFIRSFVRNDPHHFVVIELHTLARTDTSLSATVAAAAAVSFRYKIRSSVFGGLLRLRMGSPLSISSTSTTLPCPSLVLVHAHAHTLAHLPIQTQRLRPRYTRRNCVDVVSLCGILSTLDTSWFRRVYPSSSSPTKASRQLTTSVNLESSGHSFQTFAHSTLESQDTYDLQISRF